MGHAGDIQNSHVWSQGACKGAPIYSIHPHISHRQGHPTPEILDVEVRDFVLETCSLPDRLAILGPSVCLPNTLPLKTIHVPMSLIRSVSILKEYNSH